MPAAARTITIGWTGDTVPAGSDYGLPPDPTIFFAQLGPTLQRPDLMIGNLEGALTDRGASKCGGGSLDCFAFRSPPAYARLFQQAGFDLMSMANNHSMDFGPQGFADTQAALRAAGLQFTGQADQVTVVAVPGSRVAVVGLAPYPGFGPMDAPAAAAALVRKAAAAAPIVVVVFHGGGEGVAFQHVPAGDETDFGEDRGNVRQIAHIAVDNGADLVLGDGPHVLRGMEFYRGRPIAYSAGNLVGYKVLADHDALGVGMILRVAVGLDGRFDSASVTPTRMNASTGAAVEDPQRQAIAVLNRLSAADFGASAARVAGNGAVTPAS